MGQIKNNGLLHSLLTLSRFVSMVPHRAWEAMEAMAFLRFWRAQNALYEMYGLDKLTHTEVIDLWSDTEALNLLQRLITESVNP